MASSKPAAKKPAAKAVAAPAAKAKAPVKKAPAAKVVAAKKAPAAKAVVAKAEAKKAPVGKAVAKKASPKKDRDMEKSYPRAKFIEKLRRLADTLEANETFRIQVGGERIVIPGHATVSIEHEREGGVEEVEFQVKWRS